MVQGGVQRPVQGGLLRAVQEEAFRRHSCWGAEGRAMWQDLRRA